MLYLVTRPQHDARKLIDRLDALGHRAVLSPVIDIVPRDHAALSHAVIQAIAFSSANAARAVSILTNRERLLRLPAFAVGEQSAAAARLAGLADVREAGGDAVQMAEKIIADCDPAAGAIAYLSGADTAGDLQGQLQQAGFTVERAVLYDAVPAVNLSREAVNAIYSGNVAGILLYSPRSAKIWKSLLHAAGLAESARKLRHFCLSANVAAALGSDYVTVVASAPREDALLSLLDPIR